MDNESILEFGKDKFCNTQGKQNINVRLPESPAL